MVCPLIWSQMKSTLGQEATPDEGEWSGPDGAPPTPFLLLALGSQSEFFL